MPALYRCNHSGQAAAHRRQHRRGIPRSHNNSSVHAFPVFNKKIPGQKRPHAVSEDIIRPVRKTLLKLFLYFMEILHHTPETVFSEIAPVLRAFDRIPVSQMVVADNRNPPFIQIPGKIIIPVDVLHHAVGDLKHRLYRFSLRNPADAVNLCFPVRRFKIKILFFSHPQPPPIHHRYCHEPVNPPSGHTVSRSY